MEYLKHVLQQLNNSIVFSILKMLQYISQENKPLLEKNTLYRTVSVYPNVVYQYIFIG